FGVAAFRRALHDQFLSIRRGDLAKRIYCTLGNRVETIFGDEIRALSEEEDSVRVQFERSAPRPFDLVIGADGQHSVVRTLTFGPESRFETYLGYCAAAFAVTGYPRRDEDAYVAYAAPGKQAARFALRDGRTVFFLVFAAPDRPTLGPHDVDGQKEA